MKYFNLDFLIVGKINETLSKIIYYALEITLFERFVNKSVVNFSTFVIAWTISKHR